MAHIAIIGTGNIGGALARLWTEAGQQVGVATREGSTPKQIPPRASSGPAKVVASKADIILLAVPWAAAKEALASCGDISGKTLIDCINPVQPTLEGLEFGGTTSASEQLQEFVPQA